MGVPDNLQWIEYCGLVDGKEMALVQYFLDVKNYNLPFPGNIPLRATETKNNYFYM